MKQLSLLGFAASEQKNDSARFGTRANIAQDGSRACLVIPTNEEWVIAEQSANLLASKTSTNQ